MIRRVFPAEATRAAPATLRAVIAGGYTGGHIAVALALAAALRDRRPGAEILLAGARGGPEVDAARAAGYPIETVWIGGLARELSTRAVAQSLMLPLQLLVSRRQAGGILDRFRPDVVCGVGGYASGPVVAEAQRRGVPTVIHEANSLPGIANRLLARRASAICVGEPDAAARFGRPTTFTGNPIRPGLAAVPRAEGRRRLALPAEARVLLVAGGSLGSRALNEWMIAAQRRLAAAGVHVLWQCGRAHHEACRARVAEPTITLAPFLDDMGAAYAAADLIVTSAGALTVAELCVLGRAAVFVPAPHVSEDHQRHNARALARRGLAVETSLEALLPRVLDLIHDDAALATLGARARELAIPDAAARLADCVFAAAGARR
jgi:UDP-N-acetylglucosamine--N-acetylmuramyl-(pentapeptide) pyrophosphoryl-undecaprenol N-acetylglucosamine transferase